MSIGIKDIYARSIVLEKQQEENGNSLASILREKFDSVKSCKLSGDFCSITLVGGHSLYFHSVSHAPHLDIGCIDKALPDEEILQAIKDSRKAEEQAQAIFEFVVSEIKREEDE
jgi:hypothetical protein